MGSDKTVGTNGIKSEISLQKIIEHPSNKCCCRLGEKKLVLYDNNRDGVIDGEYTSISQAVNNLPPGSILYVFPAEYYENIVSNGKPFTIIAVGCREDVIINGYIRFLNINHNVSLNNDYEIRIQGFTITSNSSSQSRGLIRIQIKDSSYNGHIIIEGNHIKFNGTITGSTPKGILLIEGDISPSKILIKDNTVDGSASTINSGALIYVRKAIQVEIKNNKIYNSPYYGIRVSYSLGSNIINNEFENISRQAVYIYKTNNTKISNNTIYQAKYGLYISKSDALQITDNNISDSQSNGIHLYHSSRITIQNNKINKSGNHGIYVSHSNNIAIKDNNPLETNSRGIYIYYTDNATLVSNKIITAKYGLFIYESDNIFASNNLFYNTTAYGIYAKQVNNLTLASNTLLMYHKNGIYLYKNNHTRITSNYMENIVQKGIRVSHSKNIQIEQNTIVNSSTAISVYNIDNATIAYNSIYKTSSLPLYASSSTEIRYLNNNITKAKYGVELKNTNHATIQLNKFVNTTHTGIYLYNTSEIEILDNEIYNNTYRGAYLLKSDNIIIKQNTINGTGDYAVRIKTSSNISLVFNTIKYSTKYGLYIYNCDHMLIKDSIIANHSRYGIYLDRTSYVNITGNTIANNSWKGLYLNSQFNNINITYNIFKDNGYTVSLKPDKYAQFYAKIDSSTAIDTVHLNYNIFIFTSYNSGMLHISIKDTSHYTNNGRRFDATNNNWDVNGALLAERIYDYNDNSNYAWIDASPDYTT